MVSLSNKIRDILVLIIWIIVIISINYIGSFSFKRFDLTSDNRFTLSDKTIDILKNLDDIVFTRVYLEGDLPKDFKRLRDAVQETLDEFRAYNKNIEYEFINPSESPDEKTRLEIYKDLSKKGLLYRNIEQRTADKKSEKILFTGAILTCKGEEIPLDFLQDQLSLTPEVIINNSIQQLEYKLISNVVKLTRKKRQKIGFLQGHGELNSTEVGDISRTLGEFYTVDGVSILGRLDALNDYDVLIVAKPDSIVSEKDKFIIDQFIMHGGKTLWLLDKVRTSMDSLRSKSTTLAVPKELNLDDMLFRYGVRINNNLIMDLTAAKIPVVTDYLGKQRYFSWYFFPLLVPKSRNPIVHNVNTLKSEFISSIDTVSAKDIRKTPLLFTSKYSRILRTPCRVSLNILQQAPDEQLYHGPPQITAILLEGNFKSLFDQRIPPVLASNKDIAFKAISKPNKMIVISDGDIIKNFVSKDNKKILPLGYDRYSGITYGNRDFIMNAVNYLCDDSGLIEIRSKEFKLRLLDKEKSMNHRASWQLLNTVCPVLLIILFGIGKHIIRRKKYRL